VTPNHQRIAQDFDHCVDSFLTRPCSNRTVRRPEQLSLAPRAEYDGSAGVSISAGQ
jgi:hypothetical protein